MRCGGLIQVSLPVPSLPGRGKEGAGGGEGEGQCGVGHKSTWERYGTWGFKINKTSIKGHLPRFCKSFSIGGGAGWRGRKHGRDTWWESPSVGWSLKTCFAWVKKHAVILSRFHGWMLVQSKQHYIWTCIGFTLEDSSHNVYMVQWHVEGRLALLILTQRPLQTR